MSTLTGRRWVSCLQVPGRCHNHAACTRAATFYWDDHQCKHRILFRRPQEVS